MSEEFNNYGTPSNGSENKGMAIASMVLGIVSIVLVCCTYFLSIPCAIVGLVLGIMQNKTNGKNGMATAGIVCSIVSIVLSIIFIVINSLVAVPMLNELNEIVNGLNY